MKGGTKTIQEILNITGECDKDTPIRFKRSGDEYPENVMGAYVFKCYDGQMFITLERDSYIYFEGCSDIIFCEEEHNWEGSGITYNDLIGLVEHAHVPLDTPVYVIHRVAMHPEGFPYVMCDPNEHWALAGHKISFTGVTGSYHEKEYRQNVAILTTDIIEWGIDSDDHRGFFENGNFVEFPYPKLCVSASISPLVSHELHCLTPFGKEEGFYPGNILIDYRTKDITGALEGNSPEYIIEFGVLENSSRNAYLSPESIMQTDACKAWIDQYEKRKRASAVGCPISSLKAELETFSFSDEKRLASELEESRYRVSMLHNYIYVAQEDDK